MTEPPAVTHTHLWDGTRTLPDWLTGHHHWDDGRPVIHHRDDNTPIQAGWTIVEWTDGTLTAASPRTAERAYGTDGLAGRLARAEAAIARVRETAEYFLHEYEGGEDPCAAAVLAALDTPAKDQP